MIISIFQVRGGNMIIPDTVKFLRGYLTIRVEGLNIEKFLNISVSRSISFWNVKRVSMTEIELKINIKGYRSLKKILKRTGCQISIIDKRGLPFFVSKVNNRKMLGIGFIIFIFLILVLSSFIWSIRITGTNITSTKEIERNLAELGVRPGALKLDLSVSEIENNMLIRMETLSWIKVRFIGTRAEVEVKERVSPPKIIPENTPCDVVAKRDGVILKIVSSMGDASVKQGTPVRKGDVLITGTLNRESSGIRYVHAAGEVIARTWYECSFSVPLQKTEKVRTGKKITNVYLITGSKKIQIKNSTIPYKSYDKIEKSAKIIDTDIFQLPIEIVLEEYYETQGKLITLTADEAVSEAADSVEKAIIGSLPPGSKILNRKIETDIKDNAAIANATIETIEDIGVQEEISEDKILLP